MITFTQNATFGQLYAECSQSGADYRIPTARVENFLAEIRVPLNELLATPQWGSVKLLETLAKYNG
ncbi:hypothetical protein D0962_04195 [Leptolyngbyaceae cyanobacterium CCMR0082]|uniref:Uncharacterized protein n=1 Tax=Adonisia turfae CCMR0082 TaxID=2304604 RepID=A0A6M0S1Y6_9CYAN|nr:hypothetical protein [Adonisia turfae]NEZ61981.1 hypothetical protein [Adonisia turfae CCMR0082]